MAIEYFKNSSEFENESVFEIIANDIYKDWLADGDLNFRRNMDFIDNRPDLGNYRVPKISLEKFASICLNEEKMMKHSIGKRLSFGEFAAKMLSEIIMKDWYDYTATIKKPDKVHAQEKDQLLSELYLIKATLTSLGYLEPINEQLQKTLEDIERKFNLLFEHRPIELRGGGDKIYLKWNGEESQILTLIKLLIINKIPASGKSYIENDFKEMKKFIKENFLNRKGEPFGDENLNKYLKINGRISPHELPIIEIVRYGNRGEKTKEDHNYPKFFLKEKSRLSYSLHQLS